MSAPRHLLITGANGHLGRVLTRVAQTRGWTVTGLVRRTTDAAIPGASTVLTDYSVEHLRTLLLESPSPVVVHLAGNALVGVAVKNPMLDFHSGPVLTMQLLEAVRQSGRPVPVLFVSSAAVYGNPTLLPVAEAAAAAPISAYGQHKLISEMLISEFVRATGGAALIARIFSAYGAGLRKQLLWELCHRCRENGTIELGGTGAESRDFVHTEDVAVALLLLCEQAPFDGSVYNVASGEETTVATLAGLLMEAWGLPGDRLRFSGVVRAGDPRNWRADISRIQRHGFHPQIALRQGVPDYVRWFQRHAEAS